MFAINKNYLVFQISLFKRNAFHALFLPNVGMNIFNYIIMARNVKGSFFYLRIDTLLSTLIKNRIEKKNKTPVIEEIRKTFRMFLSFYRTKIVK